MDAKKLEYTVASFDIAIDKATLDSLLVFWLIIIKYSVGKAQTLVQN